MIILLNEQNHNTPSPTLQDTAALNLRNLR